MTTAVIQASRRGASFLAPVVRRYEEVGAVYERSSFNLVVGGILAVMFVALIGNIVLLAVSGKAANELWGIATTGMGALGGLLANPPKRTGSENETPKIERGT